MSRALHRFAVVVALFTLFVVLAGGNVTSREAGMAFTDWWFVPLSQGSLFPPGWIEDAKRFAEHGHRLVGATLGILTVVLAIWLHRTDPRPAVRRLGYAAVGWVIVLGTLGGLRVLKVERLIAIPHAAFAYLFLCLTTTIAVVTSPGWHAEPGGKEARKLRRGAISLAAIIFLQIMLGAVMRHMGAGLAINTFPDSWGYVLPPFASFEITIHFAHRVGALLVLGHLFEVATRAWRSPVPAASRWATLLVVLVVGQILLGAQVIWTAKDPGWTTAHVVCGAMILALSVVFALVSARAARIVALRREDSPPKDQPA